MDLQLQAAPAPGGRGGEACLAEDEACVDSLRRNDQFMMAFAKVIPCGKAFPHDWAQCPFAHPTEGARRRDPRVHPHTGVSCPRLKKEGRCEMGDSCPYAHSIFEYWLHPSRYRTQLCKDGGACKRWLCFFAHSLEELRLPDNKPCEPSEATLAAAAAAVAANAGVGMEAQAQPSARLAWPGSVAAAPQPALAPPSLQQRASLEGLPARAQPPAAPQLPQQQAQGDAEVAQLVLRLLERGELGPEKAAALLRQLLPPGAAGHPQAAPYAAAPSSCAWEARGDSEPRASIAVPTAHQLRPSLSLRGSMDGMAAAGWVPAAPPAQPPPASARLPIAQHGGLPAASLHLSQLGSLHGALDPPHLAGTATGQLMASGGGGAMLAPAAEAALFMHSGCSSFTTARSSMDALAAAAGDDGYE